MHTYTAPKSTSDTQAHYNYLLTYGPGARTGHRGASSLKQTSASAGLQDANPTIRPYAMPPPPIPTAPPSLAESRHLHPVSGAYIPEGMPPP